MATGLAYACDTGYQSHHHGGDKCQNPGLALFASSYKLVSGQSVTLTTYVHYSEDFYNYTYINVTSGIILKSFPNVTDQSNSFTFAAPNVRHNGTFIYSVNVTGDDNMTCSDSVAIDVSPAPSTSSTTTTTTSTSSTTTVGSGSSTTTTTTSSSSTTTTSGEGSTSTVTTVTSTAATTVFGSGGTGISPGSYGGVGVNVSNVSGGSQCATVPSTHMPTVLLYMNDSNVGSKILNFSDHDSVNLLYSKTYTVLLNFVTPTSAGISINCNPFSLPMDVPTLFLNESGYSYYAELTGVSYLPLTQSITLLVYRHPNMVPPMTSTTSTTTTVPTTSSTSLSSTTTVAQVPGPNGSLAPALIGTGIAIAIAIAIGIAYSRRRKDEPEGHADKSDSSAK